MIIVADSHVKVDGTDDSAERFFGALNAIARTSEDVVFLGDIFDLWVGFPHHETQVHRRFLAWCAEQKQKRVVGFLEGNREFFVLDAHRDAFSWSSPDQWLDGVGHLFLHGDTINRTDLGYMRLRKTLKNRVVKALLHWIPFGPRIAQRVKKALNRSRAKSANRFPTEAVKEFASGPFNGDVRVIFAGHFHMGYRYSTDKGRTLHIVPDWKSTGNIARYDPHTGELTVVSPETLH